MREIALDTETTGLDHSGGDRIFEIGCVELINRIPTGATFHVFVDPERALSAKSIEITGVQDQDLAGKPVFREVARDFIAFIGDSPLVIHNAAFDIGFIDAEFARLGAAAINQARVVDTLKIARKRFPGAQNTLDALCRRFSIDNSARDKHGALLDAELLAEVYFELTGGRQPTLGLAAGVGAAAAARSQSAAEGGASGRGNRPRRALLTEEEAAAHRAFVATLGDAPVWGAADPDFYREPAEGSDAATS